MASPSPLCARASRQRRRHQIFPFRRAQASWILLRRTITQATRWYRNVSVLLRANGTSWLGSVNFEISHGQVQQLACYLPRRTTQARGDGWGWSRSVSAQVPMVECDGGSTSRKRRVGTGAQHCAAVIITTTHNQGQDQRRCSPSHPSDGARASEVRDSHGRDAQQGADYTSRDEAATERSRAQDEAAADR
uniref:Uncharacterized protein n=1 Tax=Hyaloperonospora arabidopsidis (strain Emoy2) TaxID=559515 RepID=M4B7F7_HYAAE